MKLTQPKKVINIIRPPIEGMPADPAVALSDSIMRAVELMLQQDLRRIAVVGNGRLIGHINLSEALNYLGLRIPGHPSADRMLPKVRIPAKHGVKNSSSKKVG